MKYSLECEHSNYHKMNSNNNIDIREARTKEYVMTRYHNDLSMVQQRPSGNLPLYQTIFTHLEDTFFIIIRREPQQYWNS